MSTARHYDTVVFDVRDKAAMLFFAQTSSTGDIQDYLLLMRTEGDEFDDVLFLELNDTQITGRDLIRDVTITANVVTISFLKPVSELGGDEELVLSFADSDDNRKAIEVGAFRVVGNKLSGGHA